MLHASAGSIPSAFERRFVADSRLALKKSLWSRNDMHTLRVDKSKLSYWTWSLEGMVENPECHQTHQYCDNPEYAESGDLDDDPNISSNKGKCRPLLG